MALYLETGDTMRIDSIELSNFRCFEHIRVDFHPELTVLVAPNAGGKTAILDAIAVALSPYVTTFGVSMGLDFHADDSRESEVAADYFSATIPAPFKEVALRAVGMLEGEIISWQRRKTNARSIPSADEARALSEVGEGLLAKLFDDNAPAITLPIVAYYGTGRLFGSNSLTAVEADKPFQPRTRGYHECLTSSSRFDAFSTWYATASFSNLANRIAEVTPNQLMLEKGLECVNNAVRDALEKPYGSCWLQYDPQQREVVLRDLDHGRDRRLALYRQSDGVKAIVGLVGDLAARAWLLNPQFGADAAQKTHGIVLIDEVDLHLHPTWQQGVVQSLREAFPKVQFILTTHSPQVLSTVDAECIRMLQQDGDEWFAEVPDEQTSGGESSYIMATVMGTSEIPKTEVTRKMDEYIVLIAQGEWESERGLNLRADLTAHYGPMHPRILDCDRLIRFQSFKAKRGEAS